MDYYFLDQMHKPINRDIDFIDRVNMGNCGLQAIDSKVDRKKPLYFCSRSLINPPKVKPLFQIQT